MSTESQSHVRCHSATCTGHTLTVVKHVLKTVQIPLKTPASLSVITFICRKKTRNFLGLGTVKNTKKMTRLGVSPSNTHCQPQAVVSLLRVLVNAAARAAAAIGSRRGRTAMWVTGVQHKRLRLKSSIDSVITIGNIPGAQLEPGCSKAASGTPS